MSRKPDTLKPHVREALTVATNYMDSHGIRYMITDCYRTAAEQQALFAQGRESLEMVNIKRQTAGLPDIGRADNGYTVTKCDGVRNLSNHQSGLAVDVVPVDAHGNAYWPPSDAPQWVVISTVMKAAGFSWGGDWKSFPDAPHFEMKDGGKL